MSDIEYYVITSDVIKSFDCTCIISKLLIYLHVRVFSYTPVVVLSTGTKLIKLNLMVFLNRPLGTCNCLEWNRLFKNK